MKALILGADGFVGRNVYAEFKNDSSIQTVSASRSGETDYMIDLQNPTSIRSVLEAEKPDVVINCAGVVSNDPNAYQNGEFCRNLLSEIVANGKPYPKVITSGSAAEYGVIDDVMKPVGEDTGLLATSDYGKSKVDEEKIAHTYATQHDMRVVVVRIFNPIGPGMGERFILTSLINQIKKIRKGEGEAITVSRLDSTRDYVDVRDVAKAVHAIATSERNRYDTYNIGSGQPTSNGRLIKQVLSSIELDKNPTIIESRELPEPTYAAQADISRLKSEFGWEPKYNLETTVEDIINAQSN